MWDVLLDSLSTQAKASPRLRMNYNFHQSLDDKCHRMLNAIEPGTDIPIHRHPTKDESFVILTEASLRAWSLVKKMVFESLEPGSVIFECKEGPYVKHEEEGCK